jgi:DNA-binding Lrp family transcriptional regulator
LVVDYFLFKTLSYVVSVVFYTIGRQTPLQSDCSLCLQELAAAVDLTPNPCWKRIKRLEDEGIITGRVALLSKDKLNLSLTAFVMIKT